MDILETPVEYLKGVGPKRAEVLRSELGINSFHDLLMYFPFRYVDRSRLYTISEINDESSYVLFKAKVERVQLIGKARAARLVARVSDATGSIDLIWFKGVQYFRDKFTTGADYIFFGKPAWYQGAFNIPHPEVETTDEYRLSLAQTYQPVYGSTEKLRGKGLDSRGIQKLMHTLVTQVKGMIREILPVSYLTELHIPDRDTAIINIHFPESQERLKRAKARLIFEELFFMQLRLLRIKQERNVTVKGYVFSQVGEHFNSFYKNNLPFELTNAQKRVMKEIRKDLGSGHQMNRLLQGDVGSGKTLVALMAALIAIDNGFQACVMAPTEILSAQHFNTISRMLDGLGIKVGLLTGSVKGKLRKSLLGELEEGKIHILVGTHALLESAVIFNNLGIVVIDEQHRFGVEQRAKLWQKSETNPHVLVMTATPIPRTLAMTLYGDLDVSVLDELPPGRIPVKTLHFYDKDRLRVFSFLREQISLGRQVYVVYPLIHESEALDLKDLMDGYESIVREFPLPDFAVSIVHGQMKQADKDYEMQRFIKRETQIMVATTVIEVGVDIPNASVMVIENAERFGLSQLHQLRGRVGRGAEQSFCLLMSSLKLSGDARQRLKIMVDTTDGFKIADADLRLRGPGDIQGTQQSGIPDLRISDLARDEKILNYARRYAIKLLESDPGIIMPENKAVTTHLRFLSKTQYHWSKIS